MGNAALLVFCKKSLKEKVHKKANSSNETRSVYMREYGEIYHSMNKKLNEFISLVNELLNNCIFVSIK